MIILWAAVLYGIGTLLLAISAYRQHGMDAAATVFGLSLCLYAVMLVFAVAVGIMCA